jgi:hypothetical protein
LGHVYRLEKIVHFDSHPQADLCTRDRRSTFYASWTSLLTCDPV